jgi:hypothetical protein
MAVLDSRPYATFMTDLSQISLTDLSRPKIMTDLSAKKNPQLGVGARSQKIAEILSFARSIIARLMTFTSRAPLISSHAMSCCLANRICDVQKCARIVDAR